MYFIFVVTRKNDYGLILVLLWYVSCFVLKNVGTKWYIIAGKLLCLIKIKSYDLVFLLINSNNNIRTKSEMLCFKHIFMLIKLN